MPAPHLHRPICEPVRLRHGAQLRVRRVAEGGDATSNAPFPHYHDVAELVLFGDVRGEFVGDGVRYPLTPGCIVFVPSLRQHDFALQGGNRDWVLVQVAPGAVAALAASPHGDRLHGAFCAKPPAAMRKRIGMLLDWLVDAGEDAALSLPLAELLLRVAAEAPPVRGQRSTSWPSRSQAAKSGTSRRAG